MADNKKVGKYVAIGCGVALLLGCCIGGIGLAVCNNALSGPADAAHGFFNDLRMGNHQQALTRMNGAYQATHDLTRFQQSVSAIPALTAQSDATFSNRSVVNSGAEVSGTLTTPSGSIPVTVNLTKIGEHWYIDLITVQGQTLQ